MNSNQLMFLGGVVMGLALSVGFKVANWVITSWIMYREYKPTDREQRWH